MEYKARCDDCKTTCRKEFREVANLQSVLIYIHDNKDDQDSSSKKGETYIIHNTSSDDVQRSEYVGKLCQYRTKCFHCTKIIQKIRDLLDDFGTIRGNQILGICKFCKKATTTKKCKRCEFIVHKFLADRAAKLKDQQERLKVWLYQVRKFLQALSGEGGVFQEEINQDTWSKKELESLLHQLKEPLFNTELIDEVFPLEKDKPSLDFFQENKDMINELIMKLKSQESILRYGKPYFLDDDNYSSPSKSALNVAKFMTDEEAVKLTYKDSKDSKERVPKEIALETLHKAKATPIITPMSVGDLTKKPTPEISEIKIQIMRKPHRKHLLQDTDSAGKIQKRLLAPLVFPRPVENIESADNLKPKPKAKVTRSIEHTKVVANLQRTLLLKKAKSVESTKPTETAKSIPLAKGTKSIESIQPADNLQQKPEAKDTKSTETIKPAENLIEKPLTRGTTPTGTIKEQKTPKGSESTEFVKDTHMARGFNESPEVIHQSNISSPKDSMSKDIIMQKSVAQVPKSAEKKKQKSAGKGSKSSVNIKQKSSIKATSKGKKGKKKSKGSKGSKGTDTEEASHKKRKSKTGLKKRKHNMDTDILTLMKNFRLQKKSKVKQTKQKVITFKALKPLPVIKPRRPATSEELQIDSATTIECDVPHPIPTKMIKNTSVVPYHPNYKEKKAGFLPLLFQVQAECREIENQPPRFTVTSDTKSTRKWSISEDDFSDIGGIMSYRLSNRDFIDKGITRLPSIKIMRRMNIYRMETAHSSWFERHVGLTRRYETGEVFASVDANGFGKWFYRNGAVALEYYMEEEINSVYRYVVYSCNDNQDVKKSLPQAILAVIDSVGNCVVYDHNGNERLKYNQSEGIVLDKKLGAVGRWKWHTLNDPPVLHHVVAESLQKERNVCLDDLSPTASMQMTATPPATPPHELESRGKMLAIELDNFVKDRAHKALQKFRPFEIQSKNVKLNEYFSLKIFDQHNISLVYRNGLTRVKLNIGLILKSNEIIDTESSEVSEVGTPYDKRPAKSKALADIQNTIDKARKLAKRHSY